MHPKSSQTLRQTHIWIRKPVWLPEISRQELLCEIRLRLSRALDGLHPRRPAAGEDLNVRDELFVDLAAVLPVEFGQHIKSH
jgi:hypothetical protein